MRGNPNGPLFFVNILVVISIAIGVTLGIFCVLLIILIGFIIYWKRFVVVIKDEK